MDPKLAIGIIRQVSVDGQVDSWSHTITIIIADIYDHTNNKLLRGLDFFSESHGNMHPIKDKANIYSTVSIMVSIEVLINNPFLQHLFTDETLRILNSHSRKHPFFLMLSYQAPHAPLQAPASYRPFCEHLAHDFRRMVYCGGSWSTNFLTMLHDTAMLVAMDESIGIVIDELKRSGLYDNTIIIFSSDVSSWRSWW